MFFINRLLSKDVFFVPVFFGNINDYQVVNGSKNFFNLIGINQFFIVSDSFYSVTDFDFLYLFNVNLRDLSCLPSFCLFIGTNPRLEAPVLNLRFTQLYNEYSVFFYKIGASFSFSSYPVRSLASSLSVFFNICEFKHVFCKNFYVSKFLVSPFILVSREVFKNYKIFEVLFFALCDFAERLYYLNFSKVGYLHEFSSIGLSGMTAFFSYFSVLSLYANHLHISDVGLSSSIKNFYYSEAQYLFNGIKKTPQISSNRTTLAYFVGVDSDFFFQFMSFFDRILDLNLFVVYQGSHGSGLSGFANLILPTLTVFERPSFFKNLFGLVFGADIVVSYGFGAKSDLEIFEQANSIFKKFVLNKFFNFFCLNGFFYNSNLDKMLGFLPNADLRKLRFPLTN